MGVAPNICVMVSISDTNWSHVRVVRASDMRRMILESLQEHPKTVGTLSEEFDKDLNYTSRMVGELTTDSSFTDLDSDLVECLNAEDHTHRYYAITDEGEQVLQVVQDSLV
jgi:DNA-binding PadR family transcriptional regulator